MKNRFRIGDWVTVKATMTFKYDPSGQRTARRFVETFHAQICGATERRTGKYNSGSSDAYWDPEAQSSYLEIDKVVPVWFVRRGMTNKPLMVLNSDIEPWSLDPSLKLPWRWANRPPWSQEDRDFVRQEVQSAPRDKNGRFVKLSFLTKTDLQLAPGD